MEAGDDSFDREAFRKDIRGLLEGANPDQLRLFAARCAWRAVPLILASDALVQNGWWEMRGDLYKAALALSSFSWEERRMILRDWIPPDTNTFTFLYGSLSAYEALATDAASYAFSNSATNAATAAVEAFSRFINATDSPVPPALSAQGILPIIRSVRNDCLMGTRGASLLNIPLWKPQIASLELVADWHGWLKKLRTVRPGETRLLRWLEGITEGHPNKAEMAAWLRDWWSRRQKESEPTNRPESEPPQPNPISRAQITPSVQNDGEAAELTPTARQCAEALHQFLASRETRPPITVSVEAPWGGGKSSVMRYLRRLLEQRDAASAGPGNPTTEPIPTVWFNPWKHEAGKTMWAAFAVAFERQLRAYRRPRRKRYTAQIAAGATRPTRSARAKALLQNTGSWPPYLARIGWHKLSLTGWHFKLSWLRLTWPERILLAFRLGLWGMLGAAIVWLIRNGIPLPADQVPNPPTPGNGSSDLQPLFKKIPWVAAIAGLWALIHDLVKQFGSPLKLDVVRLLAHNQHRDGLDDLHRFQEDFRRLLQTYVPKRADGGLRRVVVFIDDLDRCEAPKAADVLQSLFQMLHVVEDAAPGYDSPAKGKEVPGIITILGMDREKVAASVAAKHESLLPYLLAGREEPTEGAGKASPPDKPKVGQREIDFGHSYLEKFIQLTLHLPPMQGKDQADFLQKITGWSGGGAPVPARAESAILNTTDPANARPDDSERPTGEPAASSRDTGSGTARELSTSPVTATSGTETPAETAQEGLERLEEILQDGQIAHACAFFVARSLDHNPRKLKQFVNLFRFRLFLAKAMGYLDESSLSPHAKSAAPDKLSAQQIAKLVALEVACPKDMSEVRSRSADELLAAIRACPDENQTAIRAMLADQEGENGIYSLEHAPLSRYFHLG